MPTKSENAAATLSTLDPEPGSAPMTSVEIFGRRYNIRGDHDPDTIRALARYVDRRMRQIGEQVAPGDVVGVAVMAALNIADDVYKTRTALERRETEITEQTRDLARTLTEAIESVE